MNDDAHQTETWVHRPSFPGSGSPLLICVVYTVPPPRRPCVFTPHTCPQRNQVRGRRGQRSMSQRPTAAGAHTQEVSKARMQFARTRCMVTIPRVSPFHCRKTCGVALSRIAHTQQPSLRPPALLKCACCWAIPVRHEETNCTHPCDQGKDEVILFSKTWPRERNPNLDRTASAQGASRPAPDRVRFVCVFLPASAHSALGSPSSI